MVPLPSINKPANPVTILFLLWVKCDKPSQCVPEISKIMMSFFLSEIGLSIFSKFQIKIKCLHNLEPWDQLIATATSVGEEQDKALFLSGV